MKNMQLGLAIALVCGSLAACKPATPEPAAEAAPIAEAAPAMEADAIPPTATAPVADQATTDVPVPATDSIEESEDEDDTPHSGGDKVTPRQ